jgi:hypothetical protein
MANAGSVTSEFGPGSSFWILLRDVRLSSSSVFHCWDQNRNVLELVLADCAFGPRFGRLSKPLSRKSRKQRSAGGQLRGLPYLFLRGKACSEPANKHGIAEFMGSILSSVELGC